MQFSFWQVEEEPESWERAGVGREMARLGNIQSELAAWNAEFAGRMAGINSPKRCSHSDVPLYISLVIIHTKYTQGYVRMTPTFRASQLLMPT